MDNYAIADQFSLLSKLMDIHGENAFKSKSYAIAAYNIEQLPVQLATVPHQQVAGLKGIGDSTAKKIAEILEHGTMAALQDILSKTPPGVLDMLQIKGLGPKKIATVWKEMGIESIGELLYACQENRLLLYKGFGEKTQANVKQAIEFFLQHQGQFLYAELRVLAEKIEQTLQAQFPHDRSACTGAYRRQCITLDGLDFVTTIPANTLVGWLTGAGFTLQEKTADHLLCQGTELPRLRIELTTVERFGTRLFETTATPQFLQAWQAETGQADIPPASDEVQVFEQAQIPWIAPALREGTDFLRKRHPGTTATLIQTNDIRGIIHSHSDWSDGSHTLEAMARACQEQGFQYLVISDHSKSAFYAKGLSEERILAQQAQIRELNYRLAPFRIFSSIECDILGDGSMDYRDEVLAGFDLVIASVHSNLKMTEEKAMQRLMGAVSNPYTTILGHPTGRLLLSRDGYPVNHTQLIDACIQHQVVLEINAHPRRLDLDWQWIPEAMEKGAMFSIDPDAHAIEGFADIHYGVLASQKGGLTAARNLSSMSLAELEAWLAQRKQRRMP